jgi:hypothetical protein
VVRAASIKQHVPLKRRSTIILHGSTSPEDKSELHTRRREILKSHICGDNLDIICLVLKKGAKNVTNIPL